MVRVRLPVMQTEFFGDLESLGHLEAAQGIALDSHFEAAVRIVRRFRDSAGERAGAEYRRSDRARLQKIASRKIVCRSTGHDAILKWVGLLDSIRDDDDAES